MVVAIASPSSLGHLPAERWAFDEAVTHVFDDMLERSIPQYAEMRRLTLDLGTPFVVPGTDVLDLGCSRGEALVSFMARFGAANRYVGVEVSPPMLAAARDRFAAWPPSVVRIEDRDLRFGFPVVDASLVLSVLTLMFVPINYRARIVQDAHDCLRPGGAFILVEKVLGAHPTTDRLIQDRYHRLKAEHGYSQEEIERKRLALEGVQVPVTARWNEDLLHGAGFRAVECVWRWCNFAMWIGVT